MITTTKSKEQYFKMTAKMVNPYFWQIYCQHACWNKPKVRIKLYELAICQFQNIAPCLPTFCSSD